MELQYQENSPYLTEVQWDISNSSACTTTELSTLLTSSLRSLANVSVSENHV